MVYITFISDDGYILFDTVTDSKIRMDENTVIRLMKENKIKVINASIKNDNIDMHNWHHNMEYTDMGDGAYYKTYKNILIGKVVGDKYKIIDGTDVAKYFNAAELVEMIRCNDVSNCEYTANCENKYKLTFKSTDTITIESSNKFKEQIDNKYKAFIAKSKLLGIDNSFEYKIESNRVKLSLYKGNNDNVTIPGFIDIISGGAFKNKDIKSVKLNDGLTHIGSNAFSYNEIPEIDIPESVVYIGQGAFRGNMSLFDVKLQGHAWYRDDKFRVHNKEAIIIDRITEER